MIEVGLPGGAGDPLVRGLAACLASAAEVPLDALPRLDDGAPLAAALGAWRAWLAGRGAGLVPIAEPQAFAWAGWWLAVVDAPDGPVAVLVFGTPPGVVLSPQDPALLGRATADLAVSAGWVVASLDPVLSPAPPPGPLHGTVEAPAVAPDAEADVVVLDAAEAVAGQGLAGDRYARGRGTFSPRAAARSGYQLTLIDADAVEALGLGDARTAFPRTRRNVLVRGVDLDALVGREFLLGGARCLGVRRAEPCAHLERLAGPGLLRPLIGRGGLRVDVLAGGTVRTGDAVRTAP